MYKRCLRIALSVGLIVAGASQSNAAPSAHNWPQFRGPNASGVADGAKPPIKISPTNGVRWQIEVPWSPSSPSVWGDRIFLTTVVDGELQTRCYDARKGDLLWSKGIKPEKLETFHNSEGSPAASTPATDGSHVVVYFGSVGLICYDLKGKELWQHPMPAADSGGGFGTGTSPIIVGNLVVLNRDQNEKSSIFAIDLRTGKTAWETPRPEAYGSFGTPVLWHHDGLDEIVTPGSVRLNGYDLKTGKERWVFEGVAAFACPTPVVGDGLLFNAAWSPGKSDSPWPTWESFLAKNDKDKDGEIALTEVDPSNRDFLRGMDSDHDGKVTRKDWDILQARTAKGQNVVVALKPGGSGDISQSHLAWKYTRGLPYVPSPLLYEGRLYLVKDGGMISSFDAKTGKEFYVQERIDAIGSYYSSPVAANGCIYIASLPGKLTVFKAGGEKPEILHQASFGERIFATPAIVGDNLYLRTAKHLWAF